MIRAKNADKGIHHALNEGQGNHVTVGDVSNLVRQNRSHLALIEASEQSGADCHEGIVAIPSCCEGVG